MNGKRAGTEIGKGAKKLRYDGTNSGTELSADVMLSGDKTSWIGRSLVSVKQLDRDGIELVMGIAADMMKLVKDEGGDERLKHKVIGCSFYEPSTRTCSSFQAAALRLGATTIYMTEATSSVKKGETLADTIRSLSCYCDAVALRHPEKGSAIVAANASTKPILNAGDGPGEHPTQALLDMFTIRSELGPMPTDGTKMTVTLVGDLKYGRTVHSLARLLMHYPESVELKLVSPSNLSMPAYVLEEVRSSGLTLSEHTALDEEVLGTTDVLYVTRVQKERFADIAEYEACKNVYVISPDTMKKTKEKMIVMHPLPRVGEITEGVDDDPRAAYFRQMEYGMYTRMALLSLVLGKA
eukprot:CAMPEP_0113943310 /NCGR_PEP_ID=MMETSP1339-20121228/23177_1 /TAXON_ID=94617 /ORGANISM="Fibrocapsa japonica" /LENGTH=352 /DNA_ID=CAMNT_0000948151 /DNA_START=142 /DNA_END=1200 /DNA_ORIENTATION=+ /assembly_acc=CAM_ASM_000762